MAKRGIDSNHLSDDDIVRTFFQRFHLLLASFECRHPGTLELFSKFIVESIFSKDRFDSRQKLQLLLCLQLLRAFKSKTEMNGLFRAFNSEDGWLCVFRFGLTGTDLTVLPAVQFASDLIFETDFEIGTVYAIAEETITKLFELSQIDTNNDILEEAYITLLISLCKIYRLGSILVDSLIDGFSTIYGDKMTFYVEKKW
jgi:hypothetical protein